jgi:hypothetical protein
MSSDPDRCLTRKEASALLAISINTLDRLPIPRVKIGRRVVFTIGDIQNYLAKHRSVPVEPCLKWSKQTRRTARCARRVAEDLQEIRRQRLRMLGG